MRREGGIPIGKIFGIPVSLDLTFFLILGLLTFLLGANILPSLIDPDPSAAELWALAAAGAAIFFASILLHELAHSLVARAFGMEVKGIRLFMLGGVSEISEDSKRPWHEFWIAVVGPLTSAVLGGVFLAIVLVGNFDDSAGAAVVWWLGIVNIALAIFNMMPGFPMDGGRVFRALVWGVTGSRTKATRIAARGGQGFGILLAVLGLAGFLGIDVGVGGRDVGGLWLVLIGWFLFAQASQIRRAAVAEEDLGRLRVRDFMIKSDALRTVEADTALRFLIPNRELLDHRVAFVATDGDTVVGLAPAAAILLLDDGRYQRERVRDVMTRADAIEPISPNASGDEALQRLQGNRGIILPVVEEGRLLGLVGLDQIVSVLRGREQAANPGA